MIMRFDGSVQSKSKSRLKARYPLFGNGLISSDVNQIVCLVSTKYEFVQRPFIIGRIRLKKL